MSYLVKKKKKKKKTAKEKKKVNLLMYAKGLLQPYRRRSEMLLRDRAPAHDAMDRRIDPS